MKELGRGNSDDRISPDVQVVFELGRHCSMRSDSHNRAADPLYVGPKATCDGHVTRSNAFAAQVFSRKNDPICYCVGDWPVRTGEVTSVKIDRISKRRETTWRVARPHNT